jgi:fructuronate reductase
VAGRNLLYSGKDCGILGSSIGGKVMKLTWEGLKNRQEWEQAGIALPSYDAEAVAEKTKKAPIWVHMGIGNIFRIFIGGIADQLLEKGLMDRGITCVEVFDYDMVDKIYDPYDNLVLSVTLHGDGTTDKKVLGSLSEAVKALPSESAQWERTKEIFRDPGLQMVSLTITEKGYALKRADGTYFDFIKADIENGPEKAASAMAVVAAMLLERYQNGKAPLALVSMDNCSKNGQNFRNAVLEMAEEWKKRGFVGEDFLAYIKDESQVSFPWTMIDKITPRPSEKIADELEKDGVESMQPVITSKSTYIAPFVNAEGPQYLVIEDSFPNGRPAMEKTEGAGVYLTDRDTVNKSERMKVTVCLNPIHTALGPYGCVLGYELFSDEMKDPQMLELAHRVGYVEGMEVVPDPGILSPKKFLDELIDERFPNPYLGDTTQRLCVDVSQGIGIRFGETIKSYMEKYGDAKRLTAIPVAIAGWLRYLLAVDDEGNRFELAPDPMVPEMQEQMAGIVVGDASSLKGQLKGILSNENIFAVDLYQAGVGEKIEEIFREEIEGPGAVRKTLKKYLA